MRPLILMPTINSRNSNACYLQLLSVHRDASTPHRQSAAAGGGVGHGFRCAGGVPSSVRPLQEYFIAILHATCTRPLAKYPNIPQAKAKYRWRKYLSAARVILQYWAWGMQILCY